MTSFVRAKILVAAAFLAAGTAHAQVPATGAMGASPQRADVFQPADSIRTNEAPSTRFQGSSLPVPAPAITKEYRFGPNDLFDVEIFEMENLKRTVRVNAAGMVSLPLIGSVTVAGLTPPEVEALIAARYSEKYLQNPQVSVFVKEFTSERITVEGAVGRPGMFPLTGSMTLLRVLALAGGFGPIANTSEVMVYRVNEKNVRQVAVFDIEKIRAGQSEDPAIKGDDLIVVQRDKTRALFKDSVFRDIFDTVNPFSIIAR